MLRQQPFYGVRGANGVMLITTKRGRDQKPEVKPRPTWQIQSPTRSDTYLGLLSICRIAGRGFEECRITFSPSANDIEMYRKVGCRRVKWFGRHALSGTWIIRRSFEKSAPRNVTTLVFGGGTKRMVVHVSPNFMIRKV